MAMASKIRILLIERNMKIKDLAQMLGYSGNNLSNKLRDDNFSEKELRKIAELLDCDFDATFTLRDTGKIIWAYLLKLEWWNNEYAWILNLCK